MNFSLNPLRGAEIRHIWKQHHITECFRKILRSVLGIKAMRLYDDGLYATLLIKVIAHILAILLKKERAYFSQHDFFRISRKSLKFLLAHNK